MFLKGDCLLIRESLLGPRVFLRNHRSCDSQAMSSVHGATAGSVDHLFTGPQPRVVKPREFFKKDKDESKETYKKDGEFNDDNEKKTYRPKKVLTEETCLSFIIFVCVLFLYFVVLLGASVQYVAIWGFLGINPQEDYIRKTIPVQD